MLLLFDRSFHPLSAHFQQQGSHNNMLALMAYSENFYDSSWFLDIGGTHNVIADSNNPLQGTEYGGSKQLHVGN